jgi:rhamnosyltransferase
LHYQTELASHNTQTVGQDPVLIQGEKMHLAARLLLARHFFRDQAITQVYHSHNYNLQNEFGGYLDTGVFHAQNTALRPTLGSAGS